MRVFVTGATGWIGSVVVRELLTAGHQVVGLARSDGSAARVTAAGAEVFMGSLEDTDGLRAAAAEADGVIHTGYVHDFSPTGDPAGAAALDGRVIAALGEALAGTGKPLVVASGLPPAPAGGVSTEDVLLPENPAHPRVSEPAALAVAASAGQHGGVRASVVRLPPSVHGEGDYWFVPIFIGIARKSGLSAYIGDGANVWPAVHRVDAARLFRIALEQAPAGTLLNAVADEGVPFREIAEVIGRHLDVPVKSITAQDARGQFGTLAGFAATDVPASSAITRERFGWRPTEPGLIADLDHGHYFTVRDDPGK
ncbi:MAG TPA: SDR family oxidoreductase [Trebonia sp.]|jgi:nucleoside-diphosphate-sugar epimerase